MTLPCPRRAESGLKITEPETDHWREEDNTCSYCGSMNPEQFLKECEKGTELTPTDKNYKVYVHPVNPLAGTTRLWFNIFTT